MWSSQLSLKTTVINIGQHKCSLASTSMLEYLHLHLCVKKICHTLTFFQSCCTVAAYSLCFTVSVELTCITCPAASACPVGSYKHHNYQYTIKREGTHSTVLQCSQRHDLYNNIHVCWTSLFMNAKALLIWSCLPVYSKTTGSKYVVVPGRNQILFHDGENRL